MVPNRQVPKQWHQPKKIMLYDCLIEIVAHQTGRTVGAISLSITEKVRGSQQKARGLQQKARSSQHKVRGLQRIPEAHSRMSENTKHC